MTALGAAAFIGFLATIPAANYLIGNVGTVCVPNGPCLVPVGFGLEAPSGVLMIGIALVLRDAVHRTLGARAALVAIALGGLASWWIAPPYLVIASVTAFLLAELADFAVYAPLARKRLALAVLLSGIVGSVVDSAVFLLIAFGSLDFLAGQIVGKVYASILAWAVLASLPRQQLYGE
jgi:queuosine precursor transporter